MLIIPRCYILGWSSSELHYSSLLWGSKLEELGFRVGIENYFSLYILSCYLICFYYIHGVFLQNRISNHDFFFNLNRMHLHCRKCKFPICSHVPFPVSILLAFPIFTPLLFKNKDSIFFLVLSYFLWVTTAFIFSYLGGILSTFPTLANLGVLVKVSSFYICL